MVFAIVLGGAVVAAPAQAIPVNTVTFLRNWDTGRCLDSSGDRVYVLGCNGGNYQRWYVQNLGGDLHRIINQQTGRCIETDQTWKISARPCNNGATQQWYAISCSDSIHLKFINPVASAVLSDVYNTLQMIRPTSTCIGAAQWRPGL